MKILNQGAETAKSDTQELVEALQQRRSQALGEVRGLQLAARLLAQAEASRLARRNPDDPRLAVLGRVQSTLRDRVTVLDTELEVAAIRVPPVAKTDTLIHGRVTDDAARAAGKLTVTLVHADGRPVENVKPVVADEAGYYAFVIDPATAANIPADDKYSVALTQGETTVVPLASGTFTLASAKVQVRDLALTDAELKRLNLRDALAASVPTTPTTPTKAGSASRKKTE